MTAGTGTPGSSQDGTYAGNPFSPANNIMVAGPLSQNAPTPTVDAVLGGLLVTKAYELTVYGALRPELIFDQFATVKSTRASHIGGSTRFTFMDDISETTDPLLENRDVDSESLSGRGLTVSMREYGRVVDRTNLLADTSMVPFDPEVAERVGYNAGASMDSLARIALDATSVTYDDSSTATVGSIGGGSGAYLTGYQLRIGVATLRAANVRPFAGGTYAAVISPTQAQQLMTDAHWRDVIMRNMNGGGNSIFMGELGVYEGCRIIVNNHLTAQGQGYLIGAEALAKVFSRAPGRGPNPVHVMSPQTDSLRRFAKQGWKHLVGYSLFRADALLHIHTSASYAPDPA